MPGFLRIIHAGGAVETVLQANINDSTTNISLTDATGWPSPAASQYFYMVIDPDTPSEEKVLCSARSGTAVTAKASGGRGADGSAGKAHVAGAKIRHIWSADEADEANVAVSELLGLATTVGQVPVVDGAGSYAAVQGKTSGQVLMGNGTTVASTALSGDVTVDGSGVTAVGSKKITTAKINDAAVTETQLATSVAGNGLAGGAGTALSVGVDGSTVELSSDQVRVKDGGITSVKIADGTIVNADVNASAAIAYSKLNLATSIVTGDLANNAVTSAKIVDGTIVAADLDASTRPRWVIPGFVGQFAGSGSGLTARPWAPGASAVTPAVVVATEAGSVIGISIAAAAARTAGSAVFEVQINGVGTGLTVTLDGTHTQNWFTAQAAGLDTFVAGDRISVSQSETGFTPSGTSRTYEVVVVCQTT